jgi:hypothetical protein
LQSAGDDPGHRRWLRLALGAAAASGAVWLGRPVAGDLAWAPAAIASSFQRGGDVSLDLVAAPLALCVWWRGEAVGSGPADRLAATNAFRTGVWALVITTVIAVAAGAEAPLLPFAVAAFLACGLAGVSLARQRAIRRDPELPWVGRVAPDAAPGVASRAWLRVAVPAVAIVLGVALLAPLLRGDSLRDPLAWGFQGVAMAVWQSASFALSIVWLAIRPLLETLSAIRGRMSSGAAQQPSFGSDPEVLAEVTPVPEDQGAAVEAIGNLLRRAEDAAGGVVFGALVLVLVAWWLWHRYAARVAPPHQPGELDQDSYWSWRQVWTDVQAWLAALWRALRRGTRAVGALSVGRAASSADAQQARSRDVRAAYRRLLGLGAARGVRRAGPHTPAEYLTRWHDALPGALPAAGLTHVYERARYGPEESAATDVAFAEADALLDQLSRALATETAGERRPDPPANEPAARPGR